MMLDNCLLASGDACRAGVASPHLVAHLNLGSAPIQLGHRTSPFPRKFRQQFHKFPKAHKFLKQFPEVDKYQEVQVFPKQFPEIHNFPQQFPKAHNFPQQFPEVDKKYPEVPQAFPKQTDSLRKNRASRSRVAANDLNNPELEEKLQYKLQKLQYAESAHDYFESGQNYKIRNLSTVMGTDFQEPEKNLAHFYDPERPKRNLFKNVKRKPNAFYIDKSYAVSEIHNSSFSLESNVSFGNELKHHRRKREENFAGCIHKFRINNEVSFFFFNSTR